ncbi:MAG: S1 RNA-binding domain-containing protein, partial [Butyricicoccus sp.]|nr:S1 RNA-binding domain-containing protein [Butyricicoccus sp.]
MRFEVGRVLEGKVTGITKFGAFIALPDGKSGMVHISEVANTYVNDIHDHLSDGQTVKVKVLSVTPEGKINLSIKSAEPRERGARAPVRE